MAMRCLNCSNEISLEETFCGQCGSPIIISARPVDPSNHHGLLSSGYYSTNSPSSDTYRSGMLPPSNNQREIMPSGSQQQNGFHQVPPQMQPFQNSNYTGTMYPPTQTFPSGQGYGMPPGLTPPPSQKRSNLAIIIISICITLAIITIFVFGTTFLFRNNTSHKEQLSHQNATATSIPTPTIAPSPSPTAAPSPTPSLTPTLTPTPTPDAGFTFCDNTCTSNGFSVEYPSAWSQKPTIDSTGTQFTNSAHSDEFAAFKTPGISSMNAGQLVNNDLTNFSSQPGYNAPTPTPSSNATIGGENWSYQIAYYQLNSQNVRIEVYATVHQGKAYIIELQALDSEFDKVNTQYFERMLVRFQFQ